MTLHHVAQEARSKVIIVPPWPTSGQIWPNSGQRLSFPGQVAPKLVKVGQFRRNWVEVDPIRANLGRHRPGQSHAYFGRVPVKLGRIRATAGRHAGQTLAEKLAECRPILAEIVRDWQNSPAVRSNSAQARSKSGHIGRCGATLSNIRAHLWLSAPNSTGFGPIRPKSARIRRGLARFGQDSACDPRSRPAVVPDA